MVPAEAPAAAAPHLTVTVALSPRAGEVVEVMLHLRAGATVADAVRESGLTQRYPSLDVAAMPVGVWGRFCARETALRDRDRVELYRPLQVDPKEARRARQRTQRLVSRPAPKRAT